MEPQPSMSEPGICLVTCAEVPDLTPDDRLLRDELGRRGCRVSVAQWDAAGVDWGSFSAVVLRSTWDYHRRPEQFLDWLAGCEARGARLHNPAPLVRWNHHKSYLFDLERQGVEIVPTALLPRGSRVRLEGLLADRGWEAAVVKPAVAASAWRTFRTRAAGAEADQPRFAELVAAGDVLVQPFVPEIETRGELSFLCFAGELSHVVRKTAAPGGFLVQDDFGGRAERIEPAPALVEQARRAAEAVPEPWLFARIDAVERGDRLLLMELELIEPELFLRLESGAPARLASALLRMASGEPTAAPRDQGSGTDIV